MIKIKLKVVLAEREMTQTKLSELTGIRLPTITNLATNKIRELPVGVLDKLCKALDCTPGDLLQYIPDEE